MATTRILDTTVVPALTVTTVHTVASAKNDTVWVALTNKSGTEAVYRLYMAPNGAVHDEDQAQILDETLSSPGSGKSPRYFLTAGDEIRVYSTVELLATVNGPSQDIT